MNIYLNILNKIYEMTLREQAYNITAKQGEEWPDTLAFFIEQSTYAEGKSLKTN
jgi:hypothetical protein